MEQLKVLGRLWASLADRRFDCATVDEIARFQAKVGLLIPKDIQRYFIELNGTCDSYDDKFYRFNSLSEFKSVNKKLRYWGGIPDYTNIVNTLPDYANCFVFADYSIQLITYAIRLHKEESATNEVYAICGDTQKVIAQSFTGFLELYLRDWQETII